MPPPNTPPNPIRLLSPGNEEDWRQADLLISELKEWDAQQSQALGFDRDEVLSVFYPDDIGAVRHHSVPPNGRFLLALDADSPVGCAAFRQLSLNECELYDVYVRPRARGRGVASMLLRHLMREAQAAGYQTMFLETAVFMHSAHSLYRSLHFQARVPYRAVPSKFAKATIWMECTLPTPVPEEAKK
jgi:ribosomal protein S18 acetylase RimI-like enzyme